MRRIFCLLLCLLFCLPLLACSSAAPTIREPINFYYRTKDIRYNDQNGVIKAEVRESFGHEEDYQYLIEEYLNGTRSAGCISPFPAGTSLVQIDFLKDKILITLSSHISLLSGSDLTIACTCLARTLLEMTDMKEVRISSKDDLLDGKEYISIAKNDFVLIDEHQVQP